MPFPLIIDPGTKFHEEFSAGIIANPNFISGLEMVWLSATSLQVNPGAAYIPSLGYALLVPSALTVSVPTGGSTAFHHIYLTSAGALERSTTAPVAYSGSAMQKTGDNTRRYIGTILVVTTGATNFTQCGMHIRYLAQALSVASGITSSSYATVNAVTALLAPSTACEIELRVANGATNATNYDLSNADAGFPNPAAGSLAAVPNGNILFLWCPLSAAGTFQHGFTSTATGGTGTITLMGYNYER